MCLIMKEFEFDINDEVLLESNEKEIEFGDIGTIISINYSDETYNIKLNDNTIQILNIDDILCLV